MIRLVVHPRAQHDITESAQHYESLGLPGVAHAFIDAVEESLGDLQRFPRAGVLVELGHSRLRGVRRWAVRDPFNGYLVFYRDDMEAIVVLRVVHGVQDWNSAVSEDVVGDDQ